MEIKSSNIESLTGFRAISAILVFFHHFPEKKLIIETFDFQREAKIGVSFFFVLSGYLICKSLSSTNFDYEGLKKYLLRRIIRIVPIYWILLFAYLFIDKSMQNENLFVHFLMIKGFMMETWYKGIGAAWSLTTEMSFYIIAPLLFILIDKNKSYIIGIASFVIFTVSYIILNWDMFSFLSSFTLLGRTFEFFVGMLAYYIIAPMIGKLDISKLKLTYWGGLFILITFIILCFIKTIEVPYSTSYLHGKLLNNFILPIFIAMLIIGLQFDKTWLSNILGSKILVLLGKASFVFYLIHGSFRIIEMNNYFWFVTCWVCSIVLYMIIEHPLHQYLGRKLSLERK